MPKLPKYFVFAKGYLIFFLISHILSYVVSSAQTILILNEIRKSKKSGE